MSVARVKRLVVSHLLAAIPRQRSVQFLWQAARILDQGIDDRLGVLAVDLHQHHVARLPLHQGRDLAVLAAAQQVPFPVARHRPILSRRRTLADRYGVADATVVVGFLRVVARTTHRPRMSQVRQQLLFQGAAGLDVKGAVDRLV